MGRFPSFSVAPVLKRARAKLATHSIVAGDEERETVLEDVRTQLRAGGVSLPTRDLSSNVTDLLKAKQTGGAAEYRRRLGVLRTWAVETGQRQAAERESSGLRGIVRTVAGVVRTVAPALVGGVVGAGLQRLGVGRALPSPARPATPGVIPSRPSREAPGRAKIPYQLYAALARSGDPRAEQLRLRGLVAQPVQAAPVSGLAAVRAEIARQDLSPIRGAPAIAPRPAPVRRPTFGAPSQRVQMPTRLPTRFARPPTFSDVLAGWFGAV